MLTVYYSLYEASFGHQSHSEAVVLKKFLFKDRGKCMKKRHLLIVNAHLSVFLPIVNALSDALIVQKGFNTMISFYCVAA